ncbi:uncharacterized protein LOC109606305 [Aethina tumida]|uniref:uncharacterized protein LOC109606305 n=1 Tax=Aethina tumida TaxID=116153 RepID=UPI0021488F36|nr:uncharacterized protein LOC109606305 [Aethina tumida]
MSQINYNLICEFECCICFNYMQPPMNVCPNGHAYCGSCFNRIIRCPMCRACKQGARNLGLERLFEKLYFPCKNMDLGCSFEGLGSAMKAHESECGRKQSLCPFALTNECTWDGASTEMERHARDQHRLLEDLSTSYWLPFLWQDRCWREIVKFDETLFLLTFYGDLDVLQVGVYVLRSAPDKAYTFHLMLNGNGRQMGTGGSCLRFEEYGVNKIDIDNRVSFPSRVIDRLVVDGKLFYRITIVKTR